MKLTNISKNIKINRPQEIELKLDVENIYLPITKNDKLLIKLNQEIKKETIVAMKKNNIPIISSISGTFVGIDKYYNSNGELNDFLIIKNNYKEETLKKIPTKRNLLKYTKEIILIIIQKLGLKTDNDENLFIVLDREPSKLYINALEDEPNNFNIEFRLLKNRDLILETLYTILTIFNISQCEILIKDTNTKVIKEYEEYLGSYPNIKLRLIPDLYPISNYHILKEYLPIKEKEILLNLEKLYVLSYALKRQRFLTEKLLTISGSVVLDPKIYEIKLGTRVGDIIDYDEIIKSYDIWINNHLERKPLFSKDIIIDNNISSLIITIKNNGKIKPCNRCGMCYNICPFKLNPIYNHEKNITKPECINCGLCTYICPNNIKLNGKDFYNE